VCDLLSTADTPLPFDQTCQIALDVLDVLKYLHKEGVVHGNIKPSNLLFRTNGKVAIADVGPMRGLLHANQLTATGRAVGAMRFTPHEELIDFKHASATSDVWSMAATLYFLFTLDLPRDEYADQSGLDAALKNPVVPIAERWAEVPSELARCIDRALSDDISVRPKDGANLHRDTTEALHALPRHLRMPRSKRCTSSQ
jgi:serine/threonine protein kinase